MKGDEQVFPHSFPQEGQIFIPGMTLRDYFAGQALSFVYKYAQNNSDLAHMAYNAADAMIAQRREEEDKP